MRDRDLTGMYTGRVIGGEFGENKDGTAVEAVVYVELLERTDGGPELEGPEEVSVVLHFTEKAIKYSKDKLRLMGWQGGDLKFERCPNEVPIAIKYEEYKGEMKMKCDIFAPGRIAVHNPMDETKKRAFATKLAASMGVAPASKGAGLDGLD